VSTASAITESLLWGEDYYNVGRIDVLKIIGQNVERAFTFVFYDTGLQSAAFTKPARRDIHAVLYKPIHDTDDLRTVLMT
jgi:hypothetical protein